MRRLWAVMVLLAAAAAVSLVLASAASAAGVVVWAKNPSTNAPSGTWGEIWIANEDGSNPRVLFAPKGRLPGIPTPYAADQLHSPQLSDDGKTLTFSAQWNRRWFRGQAVSCGLFCEGVYRVRAGVVTRVSPAPPVAPTNGCAAAATTDMCQSFETDPVQVGDAIVYGDVSYYWVNCGLSGCPLVSTADYNLIQSYAPAGAGFAREKFINWDADCPANSFEPQNTAFDANASGFIFTGCVASGQNAPVSTPDAQGNQVDLARFYVPPMSLSLAPDATRVLATAARPSSGDDPAVWSFAVKPGGADALTPADYLVAIFEDDAQGLVATEASLGAASIWSGASDGNIWRWPVGCGATTSCRFAQNGTRVTTDAGGELRDPGSGAYWSAFVLFNTDPRWSPATRAQIGSPAPPPPPPPPAPRLTSVSAVCANARGRCRLRLRWVANRAGTVTLVVKAPRRKAFTVRATARAGRGSVTLAARKLPRGKRYTITARLKAGAATSPAVVARPLVR